MTSRRRAAALCAHACARRARRTALLRRCGGCRCGGCGISSRAARTAQNPLFAINLMDLLIRHSGANHKRETIAFSKRRQAVVDRASIFVTWRNFLKSRSEKAQDEPPAVERTEIEILSPGHIKIVLQGLKGRPLIVAPLGAARALVHDPRTILLDEPTNGLDIMSTRALRDLLRELAAGGKCLLFSSHVMQEVAALCDRIVILAHGRVVAAGTADELAAQAGTRTLEDAFVALLTETGH